MSYMCQPLARLRIETSVLAQLDNHSLPIDLIQEGRIWVENGLRNPGL